MTESIHSEKYRKLRSLLVDARKSQGMSQAALAEKLGRLQTFVSKYERGERRLDVVEFLEVAQALGIDPHKVMRQLQAAHEKQSS